MAGNDRLREFMKLYGISHRDMAKRLRTPYGTFKHWVHEDGRIPGCALLLMDILEGVPEARRLIGVEEERSE